MMMIVVVVDMMQTETQSNKETIAKVGETLNEINSEKVYDLDSLRMIPAVKPILGQTGLLHFDGGHSPCWSHIIIVIPASD